MKIFSKEEFDIIHVSVCQCASLHSAAMDSDIFSDIIEKLDYCEKMGCKLVVLSDLEILNLN